MAMWNDLPTELRLQIFEIILSTRPRAKNANYAAVCKEWKYYFEPIVFRNLVLNYSCIDDFRRIVRGREDIVEHIWLRVQPPKWECSTCCDVEPCERSNRNNRIFTTALWKLMEIFSSWDKMDRGQKGRKLTLEISMHAPRNLRHHFDCCTFDKDIYPCRSPNMCTGKESCSLSRQLLPLELRSNICDVVRLRLNLVEELRNVENVKLDFGDVNDGGRHMKLPTVDCVKELTIRPLNVRRFDHHTVDEITKSFGKLEDFSLEAEFH